MITQALERLVAGAILLPAAWLLAERFWRSLCQGLARLYLVAHPERAELRIRSIVRLFGHPAEARELAVQATGAELEQRVQILRELRPGGWRSHIQLLGREHIDRALADGRGAIFWVYPFSFAPLASKKALHGAGYRLTHVGTARHHALMKAAERRYIYERAERPEGQAIGFFKAIKRRLRANGLVSITVHGGASHISVPFINGHIDISTSVPNLALVTEAALLPVFVVRTRDGRSEVIVEPPLEPSHESSRRQQASDLVRRYVARLEPYAWRYPHLIRNFEACASDRRPAQRPRPDVLVGHAPQLTR